MYVSSCDAVFLLHSFTPTFIHSASHPYVVKKEMFTSVEFKTSCTGEDEEHFEEHTVLSTRLSFEQCDFRKTNKNGKFMKCEIF